VKPVAAVSSPHSEPHSPFTVDDRELLRLCLDGAPGAWDAFLDRYGGLLVHVVARAAAQRGVPLGPGDRDDLVAEVLVEILRNDSAVLRGFQGRASFTTFLTVIARRVAVRSMIRSAEARKAVASGGDVVLAADPRDTEAAIANRDEIEAMLGRLDSEEAQLVRLYHVERKSYGEISRATGMPLGSIGPALSRARQKMRGE
jgi:RNA polymerase sigma-70 factor (ECF subfamily)